VLTGGSLNARNHLMNESLWHFVPPSFDAGCGGIDLFAGSFSFLSAEQFQNLLRAIAANVTGYAFEVALGAMCKECLETMETLQKKIQALNQGFANSCQLARGLVNDVADAFDTKHKDNTSQQFAAALSAGIGASNKSDRGAVTEAIKGVLRGGGTLTGTYATNEQLQDQIADTVDEVRDLQADLVRSTGGSAVGRYQLLDDTLNGLIDRMGLIGNEPFTPTLQDRMALQLAWDAGMDDWFPAGPAPRAGTRQPKKGDSNFLPNRYRFTTPEERAKTGDCWQREYLGPFYPLPLRAIALSLHVGARRRRGRATLSRASDVCRCDEKRRF
jgi:hypothetical protein